ncbi:MAG TPA: hypothetical protein VM370_11235 [Candidatus Thermoplasmatota archaeon]|nr:hypothetical protein [Candidatus Thermoplasmatota archaeon]
MPMDAVPTGGIDDALLAGLRAPTRQLLLQLLMYKSIFLGSAFRDLAEREPPDVADVLQRIHIETISEAAALALSIREWDAHPASGAGIAAAADDARRRFLEDILSLKDGVVDVGIAAAMRAPSEHLRQRFIALADIDRQHADSLRRLLGTRTVREHLDAGDMAVEGAPLGVGTARGAPSLARTLESMLDDVRSLGSDPAVLAMSPEAARHARDEGIIDPRTGRAFGLPVEIDMGWRGECFAVETNERVGYAELISASQGDEAEG